MATINDIGIPGIGTGILHPKHKNLWRVTFANMGGGVDSQPISLQATTVTRPKLSFEEVQLDRYNSRAWVAGKHTFESMTVTFEDDVTGSAAQVVQEQQQAQQWLIGAEGPWLGKGEEGSLYKFVTYLDQMDGKEQVIEKWVVEGCFLQNIDWGDLDYADSGVVLITLTIRFDHARQTLGGYDAGEGVATGGAGVITG
ncbi:MAG: hypothetical protein KJO91_08045 [Gammaproteobacteria bacterium]|nr:hypothetical protein [Gammaproteobacteria bacterium]